MVKMPIEVPVDPAPTPDLHDFAIKCRDFVPDGVEPFSRVGYRFR